MAFLAADGSAHALAFEAIVEGVLAGDAGAFPIEAVDSVVGDEVNVSVQIECDSGEGIGLFEGVVDFLDQDELERYHAALGLAVAANRRDELFERVAAVDRHDLVAGLVGGAVQADREAELFGLVGEFEDFRDDARGGDGDAPGAEVQSPGRVEDAEGGQEVVVVGHGLAHAHNDDIVEGSDFFAGAFRGRIL